jgi:hypothetical protein
MSMFNEGAAEDWELGDAIRIPVDLDGDDGDEGDDEVDDAGPGEGQGDGDGN